MAKILCVLYEDPITDYPNNYPRGDILKLEQYPDGMALPTPKQIDFTPGQLVGSVTGELGLRKFLEEQGHTLIVTSDEDGSNSVFEKELPDTDIVILQPFLPAYLTAERIAKAKKLRLAITAGIGYDHVDLTATPHHGMTTHVSGTTLSAQARYASGVPEILECWFDGSPIRNEYLLVDKGNLAGMGPYSYTAGNTTGGSEEAAKFQKG